MLNPTLVRSSTVDLSIVIPCAAADIPLLIRGIQTLALYSQLASETIVVISGLTLELPRSLLESSSLKYLIYTETLYPGHARNIGASHALSPNLLFLDIKTLPQPDWIITQYEFYTSLPANSCLGGTVVYKSTTLIGRAFILSTYGYKPLDCVTGTLISAELFRYIGCFLTQLRTGEDVEWLRRIKYLKPIANIYPSAAPLVYPHIDDIGILTLVQKWFHSYVQSSRFPALYNAQQFVYLLFFVTLITFSALSWNWQVARWNQDSFLYLPYATRIIVSLETISYIIYRLIFLPFSKATRFQFSLQGIVVIFISTIFSILLDLVKFIAFLTTSFHFLIPASLRHDN